MFAARPELERSWTQTSPQPSLELVRSLDIELDAPIIDVGGGSSRLVDHLLADGRRDITVLDLAATSLSEAAARLPTDAPVHWVATDLLGWQPARKYAVWHDRAVLHFFVDERQQRHYAELAARTVRPGGHAIIAAFAPDGPDQCSGLPVQRWSVDSLAALFSGAFDLVWSDTVAHTTPSGGAQPFNWVMLQRWNEPDGTGSRGRPRVPSVDRGCARR